jgi:excinuclease ABC subunit C
MADIPTRVAPKLASLPDSPGVYLWKDETGRILYVGKARRLRARVRQYFRSHPDLGPKNLMLRRKIADLETIVVPTDSQALLLENNLIKEHRPPFNISLRDDKSYPRIAVTLGETFPRVLVVRRVDIPGARFFGPYTDVGVLRRTLKIIRRIFTVRSCHYDLPGDTVERPCLDYHIKRCRAPCVGYQTASDYREMIDDVLAFLQGRTVEVRGRLRERMERASTDLQFEQAAKIRDSLKWLNQLEEPQAIEFVGGGDADAIGYARDGDDAVGVIVRVRGGRVVARHDRFFENLMDAADADVLSAFLVRHYVPSEARAKQALLPFAPSDFDALTPLLSETSWAIPQRGTKWRLVQLAEQNARHLLESFKIESFETDERAEDPVYALGRDLGLTAVPRSLVCIDISTNQGRDTVGSLVWFEAGRPKKGEYRKFKIKGEQQDDYAAVTEVVTRYITRRVDEAKALPDLMVIDGGKGQLAAAMEALREMCVEIPLASLAKRDEEIFVPGRSESIRLPQRAPSLRLLQRARDEAHRFAVTYSRKRRTKRTVTSEILNVPGIGDKRRRTLLERFGSVAGVRLATVEEVASLPGFSTKLATRILNHLKA